VKLVEEEIRFDVGRQQQEEQSFDQREPTDQRDNDGRRIPDQTL
jgi:hypothetical protein